MNLPAIESSRASQPYRHSSQTKHNHPALIEIHAPKMTRYDRVQ